MPNTIVNGAAGPKYGAKVNADSQLITRATAVPQRLHSSVDGNYFEATTGKITLTDAAETPMIYIKNENTNSDIVLVIDRVFYDVWASTSGTGGGTLEYYKNPTITGGTDITPVNSNHGTGDTVVGTFKKSMTTMIEGGGVHWWWAYVAAGSSNAVDEGRIVVPPGYAFAISYQAPTSNTSQAISINVAFYELDKTLIQ